MSKVLNLVDIEPCDVCGQVAHPKFLKPWNGKQVCNHCIHSIEEETEQYANSN